VLLVARPDEVAALELELDEAPEKRASVVATLPPAVAAEDPESLLELASRTGATVLVLSREAAADERIVDRAAALHERGVRIRTLSLFYEEWLGKLPLAELERVALMFDIGEIHRLRYGRVKRAFDVVVAVPCLLVLAACLPVVAFANAFGNPGPLLYRQRRVGRGGREFTILKLRTMRPDSGPSTWTQEDDPRITPVGRWLRRTHLDELPQAVNLLRGDLSVIGPRPEQPHYVSELTEKIRFYHLRHLVRPGITGWAQVKYGYAADEGDAVEKLQYEFWYLRHQNLALDARIVGRTVRSVLRGGGR
jgi:lipopolysaccharide/colanic/teichoic acid biosynthesis glycosyltransferase